MDDLTEAELQQLFQATDSTLLAAAGGPAAAAAAASVNTAAAATVLAASTAVSTAASGAAIANAGTAASCSSALDANQVLWAAARRKEQLDRHIKEAQAGLLELHEKYRQRGKPGRWLKADSDMKKQLDAQLKELRDGKLPGEAVRPAKFTEAAALLSARSSSEVQGRLAYPQHPPMGR